MNMLAALATNDDIQTEKDSVGASFGPVESGLYNSTVTLAYLKTATSGALALEVELKSDAGQVIRNTFWMTSGPPRVARTTTKTRMGRNTTCRASPWLTRWLC